MHRPYVLSTSSIANTYGAQLMFLESMPSNSGELRTNSSRPGNPSSTSHVIMLAMISDSLAIVQCQHGASVSQSRNFFKARQIPLLVEDPHTCLGNDIWHKPSTKEPSSCACMTLHSTQATYTAAPQQPVNQKVRALGICTVFHR
ncbi:uncharacterized protein LAJ45_04089 [Morchella importuna]|uniref:uncharacterized protein n=1 Tax=Morchella importuna TaxID=1174673 RepID=UPI001E8E8CDC|nr:uncharacterized protein LAJ45_04089 [Morchella importuna]KAH8152095.1 hypothetical protein LAJ45_04089 [Morchella importuna]